MWRRRHIEGYLLHPGAIATATGRTQEEITEYVSNKFALNIKTIVREQNLQIALDVDGKSIISESGSSIRQVFSQNKYDTVRAFKKEEIPKDVTIFISELYRLLG